MIYENFYSTLQGILDQILETQLEKLDQTAALAAQAIAADRFAFVFGTGHSFLPTYDTYPRIGSYPGWLPIHELSSSYLASVVGNQGIRQVLFLENLEGFGRAVLENYNIESRDILIIVSHTGSHAMGIDMALGAQEKGLKTIAITSLAKNSTATPSHSSGKTLPETCDIVIDTCVPASDAVVDVAGLPHKVAAVSTIVACTLLQGLVADTAQKLVAKGHTPLQMTRDRAMIEAALADHLRRVKSLYQ